MSIRTSLTEELVADATLAALVSTRIRQGHSIRDAKPYIVIDGGDQQYDRHTTGGSGLSRTVMTLAIHAATSLSGELVADAVRTAVDNFRGTLGTTNTTACSSIQVSGPDSEAIPPADGSANVVHIFRMELVIQHGVTVTP